MNEDKIQQYGDELYDAFVARRPIRPLLEREPDITIADAYRIQERFVARRVAAGERVVGKKIGATSKPVQDFLGVYQPDFGILLSGMVFSEGDTIDLGQLIQPKAEAELAFVLKEDLKGPGLTAMDVIRATDYVLPCFEIVDSRITDWKIKIQDTVADNASCGVYVLGKTKGDPRKLDITLAGMVLEKNGELFSTGVGAAVQGSPANAVAWLANTLGELGIPFKAGEVILSGSQSALVPVLDGDELVCTVGGLGSCRVKFAGRSASNNAAPAPAAPHGEGASGSMQRTLEREDIVRLCERVEGAQTRAYAIPKLTDEYPGMTIGDGYAVQLALRQRFLAAGHTQVGWKAGLTSKAKMIQMGVNVPSIGFLTDRMARPENSAISTADLVHPRVECEVAFVMKKALQGPGCTRQDVLDATDYVLPAVEIIDSRFSGFKFDLPSVVADNGSSARFVGGGRARYVEDIDLATLGVVMEKNGELVAMAASAAVLGHPADAIAMLVNILAELGEGLPAGSFVMSGGITEAITVKPGDSVIARFQELGSVSMRFVE